MSEQTKGKLLQKLATCSLMAGGLAIGVAGDAHASVATEGYRSLGTGAEVRAELLGRHVGHQPNELKGEEGKCGENKCGEESKCGENKCGEGHDGHGDKSGDEAKCGEGKCGS